MPSCRAPFAQAIVPPIWPAKYETAKHAAARYSQRHTTSSAELLRRRNLAPVPIVSAIAIKSIGRRIRLSRVVLLSTSDIESIKKAGYAAKNKTNEKASAGDGGANSPPREGYSDDENAPAILAEPIRLSITAVAATENATPR